MKNHICILTGLAIFVFCGAGLGAPHKLRVEDKKTAAALEARGARVIGNYGAFTALEADDAILSGSDSNRVEMDDDWNLIRLNAQVMDTRTPQSKARRKVAGNFTGKRLHLVQFAGPIKPEWLAALKQSGAEIVNYIPENAYLIYGDASAVARMQKWAASSKLTQWEGEYTKDLKVHPEARAMAMRRVAGKAAIDMFAIQLVGDTNSNPATLALIDQLKVGPTRLDYQMAPYRNIVVSLPVDQLDAIAAEPDVISIQPYTAPKKRDERQDQIVAGNLNGTTPSGPGYLAWLASKGFTQAQFDASGIIVDVADSGIDNGENTTGHFGLYRLGSLSDSSRVAYYRLEGTLNPGGTLAGCDGHGALNGHIIGNYDDFTGFQHRDADGYSYGVGICPFVKLGSSVIFDNSVPNDDYTFPDFNTLASDAYGSGARISSDSWGSDVGGAYDFEAQTYDKLVRDAQSSANGNQEMSFVFAAGNAGPCGGTKPAGIDSPGSAKNVITVGAAANVRSLSIANGGNDASGSDACGVTDTDASSADNIDCGSSRGPCRDGRMKPDLVAPGVHVTGGVPQDASKPQPVGLGLAISCFNALGVCALPNSGTTDNTNNFFPLGQQFYTVSSGTSHSTPVVAGACALVRQFFINNNFAIPSPAMTKAFLMNSARYLTGVSANDSLWSPSQGMGEVNLGTAFDGVPRFLRDQTPDDMFTATGQRRAYVGQVSNPSKPFRVTVAWTDAPGNTSGAAYNNDLDLTVMIGGKTYKGNVFKGQFSVTGGKADKKNNVESVFLPPGTTGNFIVIVTAANINSDGVPGSSSLLSQDFAAVIYNGNATEVATYTPMAASYNGLFFEAGGPEVGRSGAITITTTTASSYSGKLQIGSSSLAFSGALDVTGAATNVITPKGGQPLGLSLNVDLDDESIINGTVTSPGVWSATLLANSAPAKTASIPFTGNYTLIFPGTNGYPQLPAGDGYATATISAGSKVKLTGSLADGTKLSQSSVVAANGQWPLYVSLYAGQGQILGWLHVTNSGPENVAGDVNWIKPASGTAKFYPNGFNFTTHATGSLFNPSVPISFVNGEILLSGGDLADVILNPVAVSGTTATGANKLSVKLSANGAFKGSVPNPPGKPILINGVFLQSQQFGSGYFLGTDQSSRVFFGPAN